MGDKFKNYKTELSQSMQSRAKQYKSNQLT